MGEACHQGLHICGLGDIDFSWGDPLWIHYHCLREEAEAGVSCEGKNLPVLRGWLGKGRGHELSAPEHSDVWLWGLEEHHKRWPIP